MDRAIVFIAILVLVRSYHIDYEDSYEEYDGVYTRALSYDKTTDSTTPQTTHYRRTQESITRATRYDVTEHVVDIPDDRTRGPIMANYSIARPLNTASPVYKTKETTDTSRDNNKSDVNKNSLSLLQINAENYKPNEVKIPLDNNNKLNQFWNGVKEVFINGIKQVVNKHKLPNLHNILSYLNLQKKENGADDQFHKVFDNYVDRTTFTKGPK